MSPQIRPPSHPVLASLSTTSDHTTAVVVAHGRSLPVEHFLPKAPRSLNALVESWAELGSQVTALLDAPETEHRLHAAGHILDATQVRSPVSWGQTYCAIGNYRQQLLEAALDACPPDDRRDVRDVRAELEDQWRVRRATGAPYVALTGTTRIGDPTGELTLPRTLATLDWEVEIAAVIGRRGRQLRPSEALDVVAGYCVANDLTRRDAVFRTDTTAFGTDWLACKGLPGSLRLGPWLVPAAHIPDPDDLSLELGLNGRTMQSGHSGDMLYSVAEVISHISMYTNLEPGDVVCTGSPAGFGSHYGRFLQHADRIEARVDRLGTQTLSVSVDEQQKCHVRSLAATPLQ